ncbi:hypothetical protein [Okeania sp. SIO2B3]|uniref:hypothetical protein n=1 Tax=Okeania sp. SIO2B3 TaxID=2607784 RepID=UPI0025F74DD7|nr:hypothetical protein [Okeania sp. SIO2B3]
MPIIGLEENKNSYRSNRIVRQICLAQFDKKIRSIAFPWLRRELPFYKGMKKRSLVQLPEGWDGKVSSPYLINQEKIKFNISSF